MQTPSRLRELLGIADWDWKANTNAELLRRTLALGFEVNKRAAPQSLVSSDSAITLQR